MKNIKFTYISDSKVIVIFMRGNPEEVRQWGWSFYNHAGTQDKELDWIMDDKASFYTNERKFERALENIFLFMSLNDDPNQFKGKKGGAMEVARKQAKEFIDNMEKEDASLRYGRKGYTYNTGEVYTKDEQAFALGRPEWGA